MGTDVPAFNDIRSYGAGGVADALLMPRAMRYFSRTNSHSA